MSDTSQTAAFPFDPAELTIDTATAKAIGEKWRA